LGLGLAAAALVGAGPRSWADGAVAVGSTGNVVRDGIAYGMVVNEPKEKAPDLAIQRCRTFQARAAADKCQVVATFAGECFAVAYDPKPGTPGAGWGIGPDQFEANRKAIAMCEDSAGPARKGFCQVESGGCDTTGRREAPKPAPKEATEGRPAPPPAKAETEQAKANPEASAKVTSAAIHVDSTTPAAKEATEPAPRSLGMERPRPEGPGAAGARTRGAGSPLLPVGAMAVVGLAYALGQYARGRLKGGLAERQIAMGGILAVAAAVLAKVLAMAGAGEVVVAALAGCIALAAATMQ
jgi:hypothetical protein